MEGATVDGNDVEAVNEAARVAVEKARGGRGPTLLECVTYRWRGHFEGDPQPYRSQDEVASWKLRDPLLVAERRLRDRGELDEAARDAIRAAVRVEIEEAVAFAEDAPNPEPMSALEDVFTDVVEEAR
jgi:pyruvate dehydrogenase E1 component alpha subunit